MLASALYLLCFKMQVIDKHVFFSTAVNHVNVQRVPVDMDEEKSDIQEVLRKRRLIF